MIGFALLSIMAIAQMGNFGSKINCTETTFTTQILDSRGESIFFKTVPSRPVTALCCLKIKKH